MALYEGVGGMENQSGIPHHHNPRASMSQGLVRPMDLSLLLVSTDILAAINRVSRFHSSTVVESHSHNAILNHHIRCCQNQSTLTV